MMFSKKIIVFALCLSMFLGMLLTESAHMEKAFDILSISANAVDNGCGKAGSNVTWSFSDGTLTVTGEGEIADYYSNSSSPWYSYSNEITSVVINEGITSVGEYSFYHLPKLTSVSFPETLIRIGSNNFFYTLLTSLYLPDNLKYIDNYCFFSCSNLSEITIGNNIEFLGKSIFAGSAFSNSSSNWTGDYLLLGNCFLSCKTNHSGSVIIPEGIKVIASGAFNDCDNITSVNVTDSVISIGTMAFTDCDSLDTLTIGKNVSLVGYWLTSECPNIKTINYNAINCSVYRYLYWESVQYMGAFGGDSPLEEINIGENVETIGPYTFSIRESGCIANIPDTPIEISDTAFLNPDNLVVFCKEGSYANEYAERNGIKYVLTDTVKGTNFEIKNQVLTSYSGTALSIVVPSNVSVIGNNCFKDNSTLQTVELTPFVSKIYKYAFSNCSSLTRVVIPETVTFIGESVFDSSPLVKIYCYKDSYAYNYAINNGIAVETISVTLNTNNLTMNVGNTSLLTATPNVKLSSGMPKVWESSDSSVATVNQNGLVTANSLGTATIAVKSLQNAELAKCTVTVSDFVNPSLIFTLTYDANGGNNPPSNQTGNGNITLSSTKPTRDGYTFKNWNTKSDGNGSSYNPDSEYNLSENVTLYAIWEQNSTPDNPDNPTNPSNPDNPTNPTNPSNPDNPTNPTDPSNPDNPTNPTNPSNPDNPTNPTDPSNPDNPDNPTNPSNPDNPDNPTNPSNPDNPDNPTNPSNPDNPTDPTNPSNPNNPTNPTANAKINVAGSDTLSYRSKVTIRATASNLDSAYHLVLVVNGKEIKGNNKEVVYEHGELKGDLDYYVKIVDKNGNIQKDASGNELKKDGGTIKCNAGFFQKIIAFFQSLFNALPNVEVKP